MKLLKILPLALLAIWMVSCKSEPETEAQVEIEPGDKIIEISKPLPIETMSAEISDEEIEKLIFGDAKEGQVPENLTPEQQKTMRDAVEKATQEIDFSLLTTSVLSQLGGVEGLEGAAITSSGGTMKTLTPEEAKEMGIDIEALQNLQLPGDGSSVQTNVQFITIEADALTSPPNQGVTIESVKPIVIEEEGDPERAQRIQELLESGDSEALASELKHLIQGAIDSATVQQLTGEGEGVGVDVEVEEEGESDFSF